MKLPNALPCVFALLLPVLSGCGEPAPEAIPVSGMVTLDNRPLADATVEFVPQTSGDDAADAGEPINGTTNNEGKYTLKATDSEGVPQGDYLVKITASSAEIPENFNTASELKITVSHGTNEFNFPLTSSGKVIPVE